MRQRAAGQQQPGAVARGVVREPELDAVGRELVGVGGRDHAVPGERRGTDLRHHVGVGDAGDETVLRGVVLGAVLEDELAAGLVVGLALATAAVLDLVALEVGGVFDDFDEDHGEGGREGVEVREREEKKRVKRREKKR